MTFRVRCLRPDSEVGHQLSSVGLEFYAVRAEIVDRCQSCRPHRRVGLAATDFAR